MQDERRQAANVYQILLTTVLNTCHVWCTSWCVFLVKEQDVSLIQVGYLGCLVVWGMCNYHGSWNNEFYTLGNMEQWKCTIIHNKIQCSFYCKCVILFNCCSIFWIYLDILYRMNAYIYICTCFLMNFSFSWTFQPVMPGRPPRNEQPAAPSNCFGPWMNLGSLEL